MRTVKPSDDLSKEMKEFVDSHPEARWGLNTEGNNLTDIFYFRNIRVAGIFHPYNKALRVDKYSTDEGFHTPYYRKQNLYIQCDSKKEYRITWKLIPIQQSKHRNDDIIQFNSLEKAIAFANMYFTIGK